jgi:hypothetical protein
MDLPPRQTSRLSHQPGELSRIVRDKLERGELPKVEEAKLILNLGVITACDVCGSPITGMEHIAELHDGRQFRFHESCIDVWRCERGTGGDRARLVIPQPDWEGNNPEVMCAACGLHIQPFDGRYVLRSASFHPSCYDRMQKDDGAAPSRDRPAAP